MIREHFLTRILMALLGLLFIPQVTWALDYQKYSTATGQFMTATVDSYTDLADNPTITWEGNDVFYVVSRDVTIYYRINVHGSVHLILCDGATLTAKQGITVSGDSFLTIYAQNESTGTLNASGYYDTISQEYTDTRYFYGAAIGGECEVVGGMPNVTSCGTITIHGGHITADASKTSYSAGIGGCCSDGRDVTIYGGMVNATGSDNGAGIGGGADGFMNEGHSGGVVRVYGGTVVAIGGAGGNSAEDPAQGIGKSSPLTEPLDAGTLRLGGNMVCFGGDSENQIVNTVLGPSDDVTTRNLYMKVEEVKNYNLWIGGTQVTSVNKDAIHLAIPSYITVSEGGSVTFDGISTLTLDNASLTKDIEWRGTTDLIIRIKGNNVIASETKCIQYTGGLSNAPSISFERGDANSECSLTFSCKNEFLYKFGNEANPGLTGLSWYNGKMLNGTSVSEEIWYALVTTRSSLFAEGSGTSTDPYLISTPEELKDFSMYVGKGFLSAGYHVALKNDIDCNGLTGFKPIGGEIYFPFMGTFDGRGYTISNLIYNPTSQVEEYVGLFGEAGGDGINTPYPATISNVIVKNCDFGGGRYNGGIAAYLYKGNISHCTVENCNIESGDITDTSRSYVMSGGITGLQRPNEKDAINNCKVTNSKISASFVVEGDEYYADAGAITCYYMSEGLVNNYYDYDVTVSVKKGVADAVVRSGYDKRGVGGGSDIAGGAQLYVKELTSEGLSADKGDVIQISEGYGSNYFVPGKDVTVIVTPRNNYVITAATLVYTPEGGTEQTIVLTNGSTTGGYKYTFKMPDADTKFKVTNVELVNYDLWIGGTRVTTVNADNFFNDNDKTVSFSPATTTTPNTLKLKGANISSDIVSNLDNLTIELTGTNSILKTDTGTVIRSDNGTAKLTFTKTGTAASLTLRNNNQNSNGSSSPSVISGFSSIDHTGLYLNSPAPTKYVKTAIPNAELNSLVSSIDNLCIHSAMITTTETYPLWINNIQFTADNASNIATAGAGAAAGIGISANAADNPYSVKYANGIIEFDNVNLTAANTEYAIVSGLADLTVKLKGYSYFKGANTYFRGVNNGKLTFVSDEENAELAMENHVSFAGFASIDYNKVYLNATKGLATIAALKAPTMSGMAATEGQKVTFMSGYVPDDVSFYYTIDYADETADVAETQITMADYGNGISGTMTMTAPGVVTTYAKYVYTGGTAGSTKGSAKTGKYFGFAKSEISTAYKSTINAPSIVPALPSDVTVTYSSGTTTPVNSIDASTGVITINGVTTTPDIFYATFTKPGNADYKLLNSLSGQTDYSLGSFKLSVTPATMTVKATGYDAAYDGKAHGISVTVTAPEGAAVKFGEKEGTYNLDASPTYTNAGSYTVYYQVTKANYTTVTGSATVTISKAKVTLSFSSSSASAKINEAFTLPTLTISPSNLTVSYTSSDEKVAKIDASSGKVTLVSAGKTTITATYKESENYQSASASYLLTVEEADSPVLDPMEKGEENTMDPNDFLYPNGTDKNLYNAVIDGILFTLKNTDSEKGDGFDSSDNSIVINTVTELSALMALLQKGVVPGSPEFAESFTGMTFLLPPGEGYLIIESQESNGCRLMVKIGTDNPLPIYLTERGTYSIPYSKKEATYVFMWNGGPDVKSSSRSQAISKGKKVMGDVKVFRVSNKQNASSSGVLMGDANGDGSMDVKDITAVRRFIMGFTVEGFNKTSADVNYDGQINVADIVKLTGLISSGF